MGEPVKRYPTIAPCGLDCGLCPKYYTVGKSRCPGCCGPDFVNKHPICSFITCCVKKKGLETCGECPEFPCVKFRSTQEYQAAEVSAYPPARKMLPNLHFIRKYGVVRFVEQQRQRIELLEKMLEGFDDGRSRSLYCRAAALLATRGLKAALSKATKDAQAREFPSHDAKARAKLLRALLNERASRERIELT